MYIKIYNRNKGEFILMTPTKLYIAVAFPENQTFVANVAVDLQQVSQLGFVSTEEGYQVVCNGVELFSADNVSEFDRITIEEYVRRLEEKDFEITETQIDEVIKKKIGDNILRIIRQYVFDDELLIYFAWGMDNITAKDFVVCTNKQILMLDREMLGAKGRKMYKVLKNESDFDDWIRVLPDEVSVVSTQTAVKNSLKEVLQRFDTAYGKERRIEADLGGFAIVLFGDRTEVFEQEKNVLKYFKLNADEYEYEEIYKQKEPECTVEVTFRLYLCSSDYAVQVVRVLKKENENG